MKLRKMLCIQKIILKLHLKQLITRYLNSKYFFILIIFLSLFYLVFQLNYFRHWTSIEDQDLVLIHNSLLLNSGIKAEWHDHPGHTQILLMSLWLNFLDILNVIKASSYNDFQVSNSIKKDFIELVTYSRFINFFSALLFAYSFYNIFKIISKNKKLSYLITLLLITSYPLLISISHIRTELLSATFIFLSFLFLLKTLDNKRLKKKNIFFFGFFFTLSIFCKFQSMFIFSFFPLFISLIKKKKIEIDFNNFEIKKIHIIFSIIFILGIFLIWLKYVAGLNYVFFPIASLYLYFFVNYLKNKYFKLQYFNFIFIFYFLFGVVVSFILLFALKPFHTNNIGMIVNFLGASSMFIQGSNPYEFNLIEVLNLIILAVFAFTSYLKLIFLSNSFNELILFLSISLIIVLFLRNKNDYKNYFKVIISLFSIIFVFSVRPSDNYLIYFTPIIYFYFIFLAVKIKKIKLVNIIVILLIAINLNNNLNFINNKKFITDEDRICSSQFLDDYNYYIDRMRLELFPNSCEK